MGAGDVAVRVNGGDHRRTVGLAVDGDGQHRFALVAIRIGDGVADGLGQRLAVVQGLNRGQAVVQLIGPGAIAVVDQLAVLGISRRDGHGALVHAQRVVGQDVARDRCGGVFGDGGRVVLGHGSRVDDLDDQVVAGALAGQIRDGDREAVAHGVVARRVVVRAARLLVGVGDDAGGGVVAGDGQHALVGGDDDRVGGVGASHVAARDGDGGDAGFGGHSHRTVDRGAGAFEHAVVGAGDVADRVNGGDHRGTVGLARDRDGQGGGAAGAVLVGHGVGDRRFLLFAVVQRLEVGARIEGVRTVGIQREAATMGAGNRGAHAGCLTVDSRDVQRIAIDVAVIGQHAVLCVDGERRFFVGRAGVVDCSRGGIFDVPLERLADLGAGRVGCRDDNGVDAVGAALRGRGFDLAGDQAGGRIQLQTGGQAICREGELVAGVDILELLGDVEADHDVAVVVGLVVQRHARGQDRSVVGARDGDRERRGRCAAFAVGDGVSDRRRGRLVDAQVVEG